MANLPGPDASPDHAAPSSGFDYDVAVLGLGPAGITAAVELVRYGWSVVSFEGDTVGGLIRAARRVDNYPGADPSSPGPMVRGMLTEHLERFPPTIIQGRAEHIHEREGGFEVHHPTMTVRVKAVVLATGTRPVRLAVPGEDHHWVHHLWTEVPEETTGTVAVVGAGDLAVDQALSLGEAGHRVVLLVRGEGVGCNQPLQEELETTEGIQVRTGCTVRRFEDGEPRSVIFAEGEEVVTIPLHRALVSIGREPEMPLVTDTTGRAIDPTEVLMGAIVGLFAAGDILAGRRRQVAIAAGSGLDAAMRCDEYLREVSG